VKNRKVRRLLTIMCLPPDSGRKGIVEYVFIALMVFT
jgi:hypothetical protein